MYKQIEHAYHEMKKKKEIIIGFAGKYLDVLDAYHSVFSCFDHCMLNSGINLKFEYIETSDLEDKKNENYEKAWNALKRSDGIYVAGGFGQRGTLGKILAI